jgi:hypothetical protein
MPRRNSPIDPYLHQILGSPRDLKIEACIGTRHFFDNSADDAQPFGARDMV